MGTDAQPRGGAARRGRRAGEEGESVIDVVAVSVAVYAWVGRAPSWGCRLDRPL